ncbi:MAG: bifunctional lysylphosphatidylglycerol flippase/synthetase MprF, partial [Planctomycetes bacterium]|nr:bifunctional lysylphosphatidylglycerol flippase/synthetase MprF [Planctomycetota bacterium]
DLPYLPLTSVRPLGAAFLAGALGYLVLCAWRKQPLRLGKMELVLPSLRLALGQLALGSVDWVLAAAPLYALLPHGQTFSFPTFLCMFLLAQVAALVSHVPGGLGVFETTMVLLLKSSIRPEVALGALLVYRVIYYLLPLVLGMAALGMDELYQRWQVLHPFARLYRRWAGVLVPDLLALLIFLGGLVLLISGATPAAARRLGWLGGLVPLSVIEVSHFINSLVGIGLILLARGLRQRLDGAFWLTAGLLVTGIVASLLKGLDYEEACVLAFLLLVLLPCHAEFYRRASLFRVRFTPTWLGGIAVIVLAVFWLTLFAHQHHNYSRQLFWQFGLSASAPRAFRAAVGVSVLALFVTGWQLLQPAPTRQAAPLPGDLAQARRLAERSPNTTGYLAALGDKSLLFNEERTAFVMYAVSGRSWIAMGDPVGPAEAAKELAWEFHEQCHRAGSRTVFYQVRPENLHVYVDLGLSLIKLGEEGRVPLTNFSLTGKARKGLRHMLNKAKEAGYSFRLASVAETAALVPQLRAISDAWLEAHHLKEKGFSLGFFEETYLAGFPTALVEHKGKIVAFANLWPGAGKTELSIDLMRHLPDASNGVMDMLFIELMLWGAAQGYQWFNLGMAPLSGLKNNPLASLWSRFGAMLYQHGENFYNFQGLRKYKEKFDPIWEPRYLASPGGLTLPRVLAEVTALINRGIKGKKEARAEEVKGEGILLPT